MLINFQILARWLAQFFVSSARLSVIPIGAVAYGALGTSAVHVAGTLYATEWRLPAFKTFTGLAVLNGTVVGTDNLIVALYNAAGTLVASSALAGTLSAGADSFQQIAFTAPVSVKPGVYYAVVQCNGTTATTRRIAASTYLPLTITQAGVFGTLAALSPLPTTTVANAGPIVYGY